FWRRVRRFQVGILTVKSMPPMTTPNSLVLGLVRRLLTPEPESHRSLTELIGIGAARLVVEWDAKAKLVHPLVAEEVLRQFGGDNWKYSLPDLCADFIQDVLRAAGGHTEEVHQLFFHLFIEREEWSDDDSGPQRERFSPLIESIANEAGQHRVLKLLTDLCPTEPHYWNHLGRHSVYSTAPNYGEAESFLKKAVALSSGRDPLHH